MSSAKDNKKNQAQQTQSVQPKPVVSKPKTLVQPKRVETPHHDVRAVDAVLPADADFNVAIDFYRKKFLAEVKISTDVLNYYKQALVHTINPQTGQPYRTRKLTYPYKPSNKTSVEVDGKRLNLTMYLNDPKFREEVIKYYTKCGCNCEIVREGYNERTKRYSSVGVYVDYA